MKITDTCGTTVYLNEDNQWHNSDGPAVIWSDGTVSYYINDNRIISLNEYQQLSESTEEDMTAMILKYGHDGFTKP